MTSETTLNDKQPAPSVQDLRIAALWCDSNEGDAHEQDALKRVAQWLEQQADAKELREAAKSHGISVTALRKALARHSASKD